MRFLLLCLLVYVGYRVVKGIMAPGHSASRPVRREDIPQVDDIMVKDPFCKTYIPKRDGIKEIIDGKAVYFCSPQCRDRYIEGMDNL